MVIFMNAPGQYLKRLDTKKLETNALSLFPGIMICLCSLVCLLNIVGVFSSLALFVTDAALLARSFLKKIF